MFRFIKKMIDEQREKERLIELQEERFRKQLRLWDIQRKKQAELNDLMNGKLPVAYIIKLDCDNYQEYDNDQKLMYARTDYFISEVPVSNMVTPYSKYKLKKITGQNIGEQYQLSDKSELGEVCLTDSEGNIYHGFIQRVGHNVKENASTITELNKYNELVFNNPFKQMAKQTPIIVK